MNIGMLIYLMSVADSFVVLGIVVSIFGTFGCLVYFSHMKFVKYIPWNKVPLHKTLSSIMLISYLLALFVPDSKTIAAMYLVPRIVENKNVQQIPDKALTLIEKKLDAYLSEIGENK